MDVPTCLLILYFLMVPIDGETSNRLWEILEEWNDYLENHLQPP